VSPELLLSLIEEGRDQKLRAAACEGERERQTDRQTQRNRGTERERKAEGE
jgi:hypothetical protein